MGHPTELLSQGAGPISFLPLMWEGTLTKSRYQPPTTSWTTSQILKPLWRILGGPEPTDAPSTLHSASKVYVTLICLLQTWYVLLYQMMCCCLKKYSCSSKKSAQSNLEAHLQLGYSLNWSYRRGSLTAKFHLDFQPRQPCYPPSSN